MRYAHPITYTVYHSGNKNVDERGEGGYMKKYKWFVILEAVLIIGLWGIKGVEGKQKVRIIPKSEWNSVTFEGKIVRIRSTWGERSQINYVLKTSRYFAVDYGQYVSREENGIKLHISKKQWKKYKNKKIRVTGYMAETIGYLEPTTYDLGLITKIKKIKKWSKKY